MRCGALVHHTHRRIRPTSHAACPPTVRQGRASYSGVFGERNTMNSETMDNTNLGVTGQGTSGLNGPNTTANAQAQVQRVAEKAHAAVDTVAQSISSGTDRVMSGEQEYGDIARDQVRQNPLMGVAGAGAPAV